MAITPKTTPYLEWEFNKDEEDLSNWEKALIRLESRSYSLQHTSEEEQVLINLEENTITLNLTWQETGNFKEKEKIKAQVYVYYKNGERNATNVIETCVGQLLDFQGIE